MNFYLDIETIGTTDAAVIEEITSGITPPGNISKAETIAAWFIDKQPSLVEDAIRRTSFDGGLGQLIVFGYAFEKGPAATIVGPEPELLTMIARIPVQSPIVIGHNVTWDVRFLWQRFLVNSIPAPVWLRQAVKSKPWEIGDTMLLWNPDREKRISLDRLCRLLGIPSPKGDLDGSKVWDAYRAGEIDRIAEYCLGDVEAVRAVYQRMTG